MFSEDFDLVPVFLDNLRLRLLIFWDELRYVEDFRIVEDPRTDFAEAERFIAVITAVLKVGAVFEQLLLWKAIDFFANGELAVYLFLGQAEVDDIEEAYAEISRWYPI